MEHSAIHITGKQVEINAHLREHVQKTLVRLVDKYHMKPLDVHVVFSRESHGNDSHVHVILPYGMHVHGHGTGDHSLAAFDDAAHSIESRMRRYKKRLHDYHRHRDVHPVPEEARSYVLSASPEEEEDHQADIPLIIAEMNTSLPSLSVSEAVMQMDLASASVFVFRNKKHGGLNVVYRRPDHNIGWIDPSLGNPDK